ncbi:unnamed protein product [Mytilus edulis]|uniref:Uncharacterized protein n=1 Tax=Mytilus edulis TaxID=6550 RepID=A0A8S3R603_MYTED|nr:unnamed protein product [Mytilus edulis]
MESGRNRQYNRQKKKPFKTNKGKKPYENFRKTTLQELSGSVTQKWSQAVTGSTTGSSFRRIKKKTLRKITTLQELSGSVTQKWSQAVTGSTVGRLLRRIKKTSFRKYYTARVIRVSDSEMESGRNRQYNRQAFKTNKEKTLRKPTTLQELSGSVTQKWSQAVTGSTAGFKTNKGKNLTKTNYTARVIRVSDSEMESGRNRQYGRQAFMTNKRKHPLENTTLQELSGSVTQKWSQAVTGSTTVRLLRRIKKKTLRKPTTLQELSGSVTQKWSQAVTGSTVGSL